MELHCQSTKIFSLCFQVDLHLLAIILSQTVSIVAVLVTYVNILNKLYLLF